MAERILWDLTIFTVKQKRLSHRREFSVRVNSSEGGHCGRIGPLHNQITNRRVPIISYIHIFSQIINGNLNSFIKPNKPFNFRCKQLVKGMKPSL